VQAGRRELVVCRTPDGELHALLGICPHRGGLLGFGRLCPLVTSERFGTYELAETTTLLRCPWHAFEFDVRTGEAIADPTYRVQTYPVREEDGRILVEMPGAPEGDA
jgi:nitrite reductase/ring-hydroxylating ferredoxin subunit